VSGDEGEGAKVYNFNAAKRERDYAGQPWLRKEVAAEHFGVSTRTLYRWVRQGTPVRLLPGGTMRFQIGPIEDWLNGHR
jgi:hypothetical protein